MAKPNKRHKEKCKQYQTEGRREKNKALKAERHQKYLEKFAKRRDEGKTYEYKPNPYTPGTNKHRIEADKRAEKNKSHKLPQANLDSVKRRLENDIAAEQAALKARG